MEHAFDVYLRKFYLIQGQKEFLLYFLLEVLLFTF